MSAGHRKEKNADSRYTAAVIIGTIKNAASKVRSHPRVNFIILKFI